MDGASSSGATDEILENGVQSCVGIGCPDPFGKKNVIRLGYGIDLLLGERDGALSSLGVSLEYQRRIFNFYAVGVELRWSDFLFSVDEGITNYHYNVPIILNNTFYLYSNRYFALTANADIGAFYDQGRIDYPHNENEIFHNYGMILRVSIGFEWRIFWLMSLRLKLNVADYIYLRFNKWDWETDNHDRNMLNFSGAIDIGFHF